ncbi:uncharacterized protein Gasu_13080 [Galdieria sulphuraria]|uniref:Uncharacterized protein n=1 Tax=Galdieria sulphuraria TaxID=130081 RepID=M2XMF2_GALSU|nr:uncharacterized protein Gasu_13080 [Galdieria sulphuraria]EME31337.1 hypothetical protein Gasu_13080 [Galdieria sulphuraria]|eukprot:XP_005707857.1 hypothetical protein Gasu_13080 [Galdieria sulphuraria]
MNQSFRLPQETTFGKPTKESSQDNTTSSLVQSETSLPDKLKPIPVQSVILFQKQQKKKNFVQKIFSCFYTEKEPEQVKKPIKRETPKPIQKVILPETGQPPKGIAPWERSGKKIRTSSNTSDNNPESSKRPVTTENESTRSGNSSKSGGSSAPWQSGLRKKTKGIEADESYSSFSIPDELLKRTKVPVNYEVPVLPKKTSEQLGGVTNSKPNLEGTDKSMSTADKPLADINNKANTNNNGVVTSSSLSTALPAPPTLPGAVPAAAAAAGQSVDHSKAPKAPPPPPVPTGKTKATTLPPPPPPPPNSLLSL